MKRKNATRSALFTSIISLLLCVSMLVGTTFAWFTDEVVSGVNTIAAGNLDVELYHGKDANPVDKVDSETLLFTDAGGNVIDQWEPGVVAFTNLKVANEGTLALKYQLSINSTEVNYYTDAKGVQHTLAEALSVAVVTDGVSGDRAAVIEAGAKAGWEGLESFELNGVLEADKKSETYGIVIYWQPGDNEADNLFNMNNGKETNDKQPLRITLGVNLFATQEMYEDDSFGPDYDDIIFVPNYDALIDMWGESGKYVLKNDVDAYSYIYFGDNTDNSIYLNGNTLSAMDKGEWFMISQGAGCKLSVEGNGTVVANKCIFASSDATMTLNGGTFQLEPTDFKCHIYSQNSATVVINDGMYISTDESAAIAYCINGFIEINGGFFQNIANPKAPLLNMGNNLAFVNNQKITLRGGTFVNWNPMDSAFAKDWPQCPALIVLADGYKMVSETQNNGDIWYTVVAE